MKVVRKKLFYLSSADRQSTETIQRWSMVFPDNLMNLAQNEKIRMTMTYFSLLNSFENINSNNNTCYVLLTYIGNTQSLRVSLPEGNWSLSQIASNFATALNAIQTIAVFSFTIPSPATYQGYLTWVNGTGTLISISIYFNASSAPVSFNQYKSAYPMPNTMARILGQEISTTSVVISSSGYTTPLPLYTGQIQYLKVHCNIPPINLSYNQNNKMLNYTDVLAQIPILVPPFFPIIYQSFNDSANNFDFPATGQKIGTVVFYLTDQYNTPVVIYDNWNLTIAVEVLVDDEMETLTKELIHLEKLNLLQK